MHSIERQKIVARWTASIRTTETGTLWSGLQVNGTKYGETRP